MSLEVFKEKGGITLFRRLISFLKEMSVFAVTLGLMKSKTRTYFECLLLKITKVGGWERGDPEEVKSCPISPGKFMFKLSKKPL